MNYGIIPQFLGMFFSSLLSNLPITIVCAIACFLVVTRKPNIAGAPNFALWGFGLSIGTGIVMPFIFTLVFLTLREGEAKMLGWVMSGLGVVGALLHATAYILLLLAILNPNPARRNVTDHGSNKEAE